MVSTFIEPKFNTLSIQIFFSSGPEQGLPEVSLALMRQLQMLIQYAFSRSLHHPISSARSVRKQTLANASYSRIRIDNFACAAMHALWQATREASLTVQH